MSEENIKIANVSIKRSETDHELLTIKQYLKMPIADRFKMVEQRRIEFIDFSGAKIPLLLGLRVLREFVKKMKSDGTYLDFLK